MELEDERVLVDLSRRDPPPIQLSKDWLPAQKERPDSCL